MTVERRAPHPRAFSPLDCPRFRFGAIVRALAPVRRATAALGPRGRRLAAACLLSFGTALACAPELPTSQRIAGPRLLALRSEVTVPLLPADEPADAGARCEALPFERVRITPFMVTPEGPLDLAGDDFDPLWIACQLGPAKGLFTCLRDALPLELDELPECPVPSFTDFDPTAMSLPDYPSPCRFPDDGSDDGRLDFTAPFSTNLLLGGDLEITMVSRAPGSPDTRTCAEALLSKAADLPDTCIYGVTRVSIGPIEKLLALAAGFGVTLPPELGQVPDPKDIPDGDRNPRIARVKVTVQDGESGDQVEYDDVPAGAPPIPVRRGDVIAIEATTPAGDLQTYPVAINPGIGGTGTETQMERIDGSWFRTWGRLLSGGSDDREAYNEWTMERGRQDEDDLPPGGRAHLFYVLRDSRLGVSWWWLEVEVSP